MIVFKEVTEYEAVIPEVLDLLQAHKEEVGLFGDDIPLSPAWDRYMELAKLGALQWVSARNDDGELVGYSSDILTRHLHYDFLIGINDIIYLKPGYRGYGIKLIRYVENLLLNKGAKFYTLSIKPHVDFSPVVKRLKYSLLESQYFRRL